MTFGYGQRIDVSLTGGLFENADLRRWFRSLDASVF